MLILPFPLTEDEEPYVIDDVVATELLTLWPLHADELEYNVREARQPCAIFSRLLASLRS